MSAPAPLPVSCAQARDRFAAYLDERLGREDRQAVRRHLEDCAACRGEASEQDPAFAFAFLGEARIDVSPEDTAAVLAAVRTGIELKKAERRVEGRPTSRFRIAVSVAAAALVAAVIGTSGSTRAPGREPAEPAKVAGKAAEASAPESAASAVAESTGPLSPFAEARGPAKGQKLPADATIYDWNPGGGQPRVVWIVDRSLDI